MTWRWCCSSRRRWPRAHSCRTLAPSCSGSTRSGHGLSNGDLLRPTLSDYRKPPALYHPTGFFVSAFFGGPVGAGVYAGANAWRLGRLWRDLPVILCIVAGAFLVMLELQRAGAL